MELEIRKKKNENHNFKYSVFYQNEFIGVAEEGVVDEKYSIVFLEDKEDIFLECSFQDLLKVDITSINLSVDTNLFPELRWAMGYSTVCISLYDTPYIYIDPDIVEWNKQISYVDFMTSLKSLLDEEESIEHDINLDFQLDHLAFSVRFLEKKAEFQIKEVYNFILKKLSDISQEIFLLVEQEIEEGTFINRFSFPPEIQSSCEQYLTYFSTFLRDIGIEAESVVESKVHETLFKVKPSDSETALSQIKEALNMYLQIPNIEDFEKEAYGSTDIGVLQLLSNVHFLKSQLHLAKATIQAQDSAIENLKLLNYKLVSENDTSKDKDEEGEKFFDGVITLTKANLKNYGVKIDTPKLIQMIKRKFR